jgi:hypothetical protein
MRGSRATATRTCKQSSVAENTSQQTVAEIGVVQTFGQRVSQTPALLATKFRSFQGREKNPENDRTNGFRRMICNEARSLEPFRRCRNTHVQ